MYLFAAKMRKCLFAAVAVGFVIFPIILINNHSTMAEVGIMARSVRGGVVPSAQ